MVKFTLVDVEGIYLDNPGDELIINEPAGFSSFQFNIERDEEYRGMTAEFGDGGTELGFDWIPYVGTFGTETVSPHQMLKSILESVSHDAKVLLRYYTAEGATETLDYEWALVFKDVEEIDDLINFIVKRENFDDKFRTRIDTEVNVSASADLDGNTTTPLTLITLPLHSMIERFRLDADVLLPTISSYDYETANALENTTTVFYGRLNFQTVILNEFSRYNIPVAEIKLTTPMAEGEYTLITDYKGKTTIDISGAFDFNATNTTVGAPAYGGAFSFRIVLVVRDSSGDVRHTETIYNGDNTITSFDSNPIDIEDSFTGSYEYTDIAADDEIYFYWYFAPEFETELGTIEPYLDDFTMSFSEDSGNIQITQFSEYPPSTVEGAFIFDALNDSINKAVGQTGRNVTVQTFGGGFTVGETIHGVFFTVLGSGVLISETDIGGGLFDLAINVTYGYFFEGFSAEGQTSLVDQVVNTVSLPTIIESTLLAREENGAATDGIGALNFVTTGKKIRQLTGTDFNVMPSKLLDFVRCRFNGGFSIVDDGGKKVVIEEASEFFQDINILTLSSVETPAKRALNNELLYNEVEAGYTKFAKENENNSIEGFNTKRTWLTPIEKEKKKLPLIAPVVTDGAEIERLRRLEIKQDESDQSDEELFIIKCRRFNQDNDFFHEDYDTSKMYVVIDDANNKIYLKGFYLEGQLTIATEIILSVTSGSTYTQTITIDSVTFDADNNQTIINTTEPITAPDSNYVLYSFYFDVDVFLPERLEAFSIPNVSGLVDKYSEYNLDHAPTNFLLYWYNFLGSNLIPKDQTKTIKFTQGTNNVSLSRRYKTGAGITTSQIVENQDFRLGAIRSINSEIFTQYTWRVVAYIGHADFIELRNSLLGQSQASPPTNFGYIEFTDNFGNLVKIFPIAINRNPATYRTEIYGWQKQVPTPAGTNYLLLETGDKIELEDGTGFIEQEY